MDLESKLSLHPLRSLLRRDSSDNLPNEFLIGTQQSPNSSFSDVDQWLCFATFGFVATALLPFFLSPFSSSRLHLKAVSLTPSEGLGFVSFLDRVDDLSGNRAKDMFGWGGLDVVYRASQALAPHLQNCRAQIQNQNVPAGLTFHFDVKIDVKRPGFLVTGLLAGHETEPNAATCLRDTINGLQIGSFSTLRSAPTKSYKLDLGIQLSHGSDGGAP